MPFLDSREIACSPTSRIHGYDFSNQGLMGIWEGFQALPQSSEPRDSTSLLNDIHSAAPAFESSSASTLGLPSTFSQSFEDLSYGDFNAAITAILSRQGIEKTSWSPTLRTNKSAQRELALQLCGWYLREDEFSDAITKYGVVLIVVRVVSAVYIDGKRMDSSLVLPVGSYSRDNTPGHSSCSCAVKVCSPHDRV